jgi:3-hydroxypropanoate dehydrogenase
MSDATASSQIKTFAETFAESVTTLDPRGLDLLFRQARTHNVWTEKPVSETLLRRVHDLMKMAPTSMNMCPARIVFVKSDAAKQRLKPCLVSGNVEKTMTAPVTAVIGHDLAAWEHLPRLFPYKDMRGMFQENPVMAEEAAFRNGSLQGGYFIMAARAFGLDCGPMSGFDNSAVDREFFADSSVRSNFICNLGYGAGGGSYKRAPRFDFEEVCEVL